MMYDAPQWGDSHLAAAAGAAVITMFGPTAPAHWCPPRALALPFALDHAQRPSCAAILAHSWLQDRPVFRRHTIQAHYGPTVFLQSCLDDEGLALLRGDEFFTADEQDIIK